MASREYSKSSTFILPEKPPDKTIDIGCGGKSVSMDPFGRILQFGIPHENHGIIVAVPFEQFDGSRFRDPKYVRKYRTRMLQRLEENKGGFGLDLGCNKGPVSIQILNGNLASFKYTLENNLNVIYTTKVLEYGGVIQTATVTNKGQSRISHTFSLNLCISLNRAPYGQLTDRGPIPLPLSKNVFCKANGEVFKITNPHLIAQLMACVEMNDEILRIPVESLDYQEVEDGPLDICPKYILDIMPGETVVVEARFGMTPSIDSMGIDSFARTTRPVLVDIQYPRWKSNNLITTYILRRAVDYNLAACAVPISDTAVAVITDHVALPLGWPRDNYYQIRVLLETYKHLNILMEPECAFYYQTQIKRVADGHVEWVFNKAVRPEKYWRRSYLVTGKPKDGPLFQLDQQCYPLLELCDYYECFPEQVETVKRIVNGSTITEVLKYLEEMRDPSTRLFLTEETPGDDPVEYPYHFSSHVLLWWTYTRLSRLWARVKPLDTKGREGLELTAKETRDQTLKSFTSQHPETKKLMFAYSTDGHGKYEFYHDANDVPTLFADEWSFVQTSEEKAAWKNTMEFGLSTSNEEGYCVGPYFGLGSRHSPGTWVLGLFQELGFAERTGQRGMTYSAWERILAAMQWDGTFSEAVDTKTAKCSSKAWFSWPGSMIGAQIIKMRVEEKEDYLLKGTGFNRLPSWFRFYVDYIMRWAGLRT